MDHRAVLQRTHNTLTHLTTLLAQAVAVTEDTPLKSSIGGGSSTSISDPTPSAAARRRRTPERQNLDRLLTDIATDVTTLHRLCELVTTPTRKTGPCWVCRKGKLTQPLTHDGLCTHCVAAADKAERRATTLGQPFDRDNWRRTRTNQPRKAS